MNIIILTSSLQGLGSHQLKRILQSDTINVKMIVVSKGEIRNKKRYAKRKIRKILKIGIFGALNGFRMRKWYSTESIGCYLDDIEPLDKICSDSNIPFKTTPTINCQQTISIFREANADLGLSLGNGYIGSKVFMIPKLGMINIHHEELPDYQNAQSIIWQIFNHSSFTGYTIHKIDKHIDTGEILYKEKIPIVFRNNLSDTVSYNCARLWERSALGFVKLLENFSFYFEHSVPQKNGNSYTTPSLFQYMKIVRQFKKMRKMQELNSVQNGNMS